MSDQTYAIFEWINKAYFETVLESHEGTKVSIIEHDVKHATSKGENYLGAMFRATVKYTIEEKPDQKDISLIIKARMDDSLLSEVVAEYNIFERESQAYKCIIKEITRLLRGIQDETVFAPSLVYVDSKAIIQEDLSVRKYKIKDCKKRLDLKECKMVLEKVAKFHAATAVLQSQNPEAFSVHMQSNVTDNFNLLHLFYQNSVASCLKYARTVKELEGYVEKLEKFQDQVIPRMVDVFKRDDDSFNVLNHGDLWVNNLMFHSDSNGVADDVLLIDYQEGFFGSPGIDLNWFIFTSCNQEVIAKDIPTLHQFYFDVLTDTLKKLKYPKQLPSFSDIEKEIEKKANHGLTTLICFTAIFLNEKTEYADAANFISDAEECEKVRTIVFSNPEYAKFLAANLPIFVKGGQF